MASHMKDTIKDNIFDVLLNENPRAMEDLVTRLMEDTQRTHTGT